MNSERTDLLQDLPANRISAFEQAGGLMLALLLTAASGLVAGLHHRRRAGLALGAAALAGAGGLSWVFRHPQRSAQAGAEAILAACDGRVLAVSPVFESRFLHKPSTCVEIATTLTQVQVNWAPSAGVIAYRRYEPGRRQAGVGADDSSWLGIQRSDGQRLLLRQIAARAWRPIPWHLARRIICWPEISDRVARGEVIGHLPLGGTVQVYLPASAGVQVQRGQRVRGGETVLALLPAAPTRS